MATLYNIIGRHDKEGLISTVAKEDISAGEFKK
jgi:hypothetical protein